MNHDIRFARVSEAELRWRRIGGLAAIVSLVALIAGLALAIPEAQAPGVAAGAAHSATAATGQEGRRAAPASDQALPAVCGLVLPESGDCEYY